MSKPVYDWIVVGGGVSGIAVAEILCREDKSVLLIEKNELLASETSKQFHEWVHSGALYTLVPDNLLTLRYLLGATDDLLQFYSSFPRMNLIETDSGVGASGAGWFNSDRIAFKYRIRKLNPIWMALVSRSISIIDLIGKHDWLRRKAGSEYGRNQLNINYWVKHIWKQLNSSEKFFTLTSPDITMNSRVLLQDLLKVGLAKGLELVVGEEVLNIDESGVDVKVKTVDGLYHSHNVVICSPDVIASKYKLDISTGFAPMAIVEGVPEEEVSFVELDYHVKTCINLLKKGNGIGQAGGITVNSESEIEPYLNYVIAEHKKRNPSIEVIDTYVGIKKELVSKGQDRNYLYHINQNSDRVWSIVLGKFTLAFSMAPEFYRRVFNKNPIKYIDNVSGDDSEILSETSWQEIVTNHKY
ncbi:FAD-dependent oxidoreductase [Gammaproteobacteria bacterium]|nr:FAD-dependent oxidoreductase [Gammaproteobacteria bacterium]